MILDIAFILGAYLFGSVSSAVIVCKLMGLPDPRTEGSKNPGATNVLRIGGKKAAAVTLLGDTLKGALPMLAAVLMELSPAALGGVGLAAFLGHLHPVFFGFQGGKGVATALGVQFGLHWMAGAAVGLLWLATAKLGNISSLSALTAMALAPAVIWLVRPAWELVLMQLLISALLFWRHRTNIRRILNGSEPRIKP